MRHRLLLLGGIIYLVATNIVWIARDTRPPFFDMAFHQTAAVHTQQSIAERGAAGLLEVPNFTGSYPPLYHLIVAAAYAAFGTNVDTAQLANLPATVVLMLATRGIARTVFPPLWAAISGVLAGFVPYLLWISRETLTDYWLTAFVALAMWTLLATTGFSRRRESAIFGIVAGLGMLTKWTFIVFVALPFIWAARRHWKNAAMSAAIAALISAFWYAGQWRELIAFFGRNTAGGVTEGDPARLTLQAFIFYIRALEGYQFFLPLFVLFVAGLALLRWRYTPDWMPILLWIAGGWLGLLFFQNKDPRYSAPLLPAVAICGVLSVSALKARLAVPVFCVFLALQHYLVSFGVRQLPEEVVLLTGLEGPFTWNWNLYTQTYFGLWGPPRAEDWKIEYVLEKVGAGGGPVRLGMIPDIPRFDATAFEFYIAKSRRPVVIHRLWSYDEEAIRDNDYILMSETDQGFTRFFAQGIDRINRFILDRPESFEVMEWFRLPDGTVIRLYRVNRS